MRVFVYAVATSCLGQCKVVHFQLATRALHSFCLLWSLSFNEAFCWQFCGAAHNTYAHKGSHNGVECQKKVHNLCASTQWSLLSNQASPPPFSIPLSPSPLLYTGKWQWAARHQFESELESFCHCCLFCFHAFVRPFSTLFTRALSLTLPFLMSCNYI